MEVYLIHMGDEGDEGDDAIYLSFGQARVSGISF